MIKIKHFLKKLFCKKYIDIDYKELVEGFDETMKKHRKEVRAHLKEIEEKIKKAKETDDKK